MPVIGCCSVLYVFEQTVFLQKAPSVCYDGFHSFSLFAESDDLRGDPALSHQSAPAPQDARTSVVDAGGLRSITQCPKQLPQMMAAGKSVASPGHEAF